MGEKFWKKKKKETITSKFCNKKKFSYSKQNFSPMNRFVFIWASDNVLNKRWFCFLLFNYEITVFLLFFVFLDFTLYIFLYLSQNFCFQFIIFSNGPIIYTMCNPWITLPLFLKKQILVFYLTNQIYKIICGKSAHDCSDLLFLLISIQ